MSDDSLSQCVLNQALHYLPPDVELNQWSEDGWDAGPVCGFWDGSLVMLPVIDFYWRLCAASTDWLYWFLKFSTDTIRSVSDPYQSRSAPQWRFSKRYKKCSFNGLSHCLKGQQTHSLWFTINIITRTTNPTALVCFKCISIYCVDDVCMGSLSGRLGECFFSSIFLYFSLCLPKDWRKFVIRIECTDQQCVMLAMVHLRVSVMTQRRTVRVSY